MKIKVCGLRDKSNVKDLMVLSLDYMGFIFYSKSARFVGDDFDAEITKMIPLHIRKVGVFVNESVEKILALAKKYQLDVIQLHGDESPEDCKLIKDAGLEVFKAFQLNEAFQFKVLDKYHKTCDYFLFDTKSEAYGGSGKKFNWEILKKYKGETAFFLSGGIGSKDVEAIKEFKHPKLVGLDVNSGFEKSPALKDAVLVKEFLKSVRQN
ncbi:N-(5'-phosphoribosyl)anthranilate isomerase [Labilibaculum filiforme]|uniref:N-(5'-phosphoribosyl)anthranilate isomerase n=1 Tax=Labilibaculum filiforme TaxID=1940526 RepID=A0A2N3HT50_9BACT|nr:phosphoribosylanthranilate isomerase [Labilibaculum filiforme]PKQ61213.1 N-(5'-phosphoribosyl)anthranilate isomerase [Labilibaculum filiforme]